MKATRLLLAMWLTTMSLTTQAQFNTVARNFPRYRIEAIQDKVPSEAAGVRAGLPGQPDSLKRQTEPPTHLRVSDDSVSHARQACINRYMSVSYPLSSIVVTSPFDERTDPFTGRRAKHDGLDLRAPLNSEVYAMLPGKVVKVGSDRRSGNYVTLRHGRYTVTYCHLSLPLVRKGSLVSPGSLIAMSGSTGRSTANHLHIGVKLNGKPIDPCILLDYIRATRSAALTQLASLY